MRIYWRAGCQTLMNRSLPHPDLVAGRRTHGADVDGNLPAKSFAEADIELVQRGAAEFRKRFCRVLGYITVSALPAPVSHP